MFLKKDLFNTKKYVFTKIYIVVQKKNVLKKKDLFNKNKYLFNQKNIDNNNVYLVI